VRDILAGVVLIAIGLLFGGSVFRGEFTIWSVLFDGLGVFLIVLGVIKLVRARRS
jgi:hypothetical protein